MVSKITNYDPVPSTYPDDSVETEDHDMAERRLLDAQDTNRNDACATEIDKTEDSTDDFLASEHPLGPSSSEHSSIDFQTLQRQEQNDAFFPASTSSLGQYRGLLLLFTGTLFAKMDNDYGCEPQQDGKCSVDNFGVRMIVAVACGTVIFVGFALLVGDGATNRWLRRSLAFGLAVLNLGAIFLVIFFDKEYWLSAGSYILLAVYAGMAVGLATSSERVECQPAGDREAC